MGDKKNSQISFKLGTFYEFLYFHEQFRLNIYKNQLKKLITGRDSMNYAMKVYPIHLENGKTEW